MALDIVGTILKVSIGGYPFRVAADADAAHAKPGIMNEAEVSTGGIMRKKTVQSQEITGLPLKANAAELEILRGIDEGDDDVTLAYTTAAGDTYRGEGFISYESASTQTGSVEVSLFPRNGWTLFERS